MSVFLSILISAYAKVLPELFYNTVGRILVRRKAVHLRRRDNCLGCGFLGKRVLGNPELLEIQHIERETIVNYDENKLPCLECHKGLVEFPHTPDSAPPGAKDINTLVLISRTSCRHHLSHSPGRTPHEHLQLELEQRRQRSSQYAVVISSSLLLVSIVVNLVQAVVA